MENGRVVSLQMCEEESWARASEVHVLRSDQVSESNKAACLEHKMAVF